jgi:hypothetical protein
MDLPRAIGKVDTNTPQQGDPIPLTPGQNHSLETEIIEPGIDFH